MAESCCGDLREVLSPRLFKALSDPTRLAIVALLARTRAALPVGDVAASCPVDLSVVSRHLATLRDAGVVSSRRRGKQVFYQARCDVLARTLRSIADALDACCPPDAGDGPSHREAEPGSGSSPRRQPERGEAP